MTDLTISPPRGYETGSGSRLFKDSMLEAFGVLDFVFALWKIGKLDGLSFKEVISELLLFSVLF